MTPDDRAVLRRLVDQLANVLQATILVAEHLELAAGTTAQDAKAITRQLGRMTRLLHDAQQQGGVQ
jgi:hypothetical protein